MSANNRKVIHTDAAPSAIGPYSQAISANGTVYISGQIPLDPATGEVVDGDFKAQVKQVFDNLAAVAKAAGGSLEDAVRVTIYLTDMSKFAAVNEVMEAKFAVPYPARAAIGVAELP